MLVVEGSKVLEEGRVEEAVEDGSMAMVEKKKGRAARTRKTRMSVMRARGMVVVVLVGGRVESCVVMCGVRLLRCVRDWSVWPGVAFVLPTLARGTAAAARAEGWG